MSLFASQGDFGSYETKIQVTMDGKSLTADRTVLEESLRHLFYCAMVCGKNPLAAQVTVAVPITPR